MRPKDCAYIVERLAIRFMALVADHSRQLSEHRTSFGARTEADAKIIAGLRADIDSLKREELATNETLKPLVDRVVKERDGLLTQVQDMRAEKQRLSAQLDWERAEIKRLQWENVTMHKDAEDGYAAAIKVLGDPVALSKERDALRAEVAELKTQLERLTSWAAKNQAARETLQNEIEKLKSQTPKQHPVKVGEWVRRTKLPGDQSPVGIVKQVTSIRCDGDSYGFADRDFWSVDNCEPCTHQHPAQDGQWVRRTIASGTEPVGTMIQVQRSRTLHSEYVTRKKRVVPWAHCEPCDPPNHDTVQGKAAAESAVKEIKEGNVAKVVGASGDLTAQSDIGKIGEVLKIDFGDGTVLLSGAGWVNRCDVRKVTT